MGINKGALAVATMLAAVPVLAQSRSIAPEIKPSSLSKDLCVAIMEGMYAIGKKTKLVLQGTGGVDLPKIVGVEQSVSGVRTECSLTSAVTLGSFFKPRTYIVDDGVVSTFDDYVRAVTYGLVLEENGFPGGPDSVGSESGAKPPYQFVDYSGSEGGQGPDGIVDNVCDENICQPLYAFPFDQQKALQARYEQAVKTTLARFEKPAR